MTRFWLVSYTNGVANGMMCHLAVDTGTVYDEAISVRLPRGAYEVALSAARLVLPT